MATFSLIVPVYNAAKFIEACINSILAQSYKDFELILVDDSSVDDSLKIIRTFVDGRIKIFEKKNGGTASARNFGMNHATSNYICFIDSDDVVSHA